MKLAESWFHTCKILLSRFHFVSIGSAPLRLDWGSAKSVAFARLDESQASFVYKVQRLVANQGRRSFDVVKLTGDPQLTIW